MDKETTQTNWKSLYKLGGGAALVTVAIMFVESLITLLPGGGITGPGGPGVLEWFALMQDNPLMGMRNLGLVNMIAASASIPIFFALYAAHREADKVYAALALILFVIGTSIYLANNSAFAMLALSQKYAAASSEAHQAQLAAAGEALLAQAESHTPGTFVGFLYTEMCSILISIVMLRGRVFSRITAYAGILGFGCLFIYEVLACFVPALFSVAIIFVIAGGLLSLVWTALIARRLLQLGSNLS